MSGNSQAVRLPKEFRISCKRVRVTKMGNSLVLTPVFDTLNDMWAEIDRLGGDDFMPNDGEQPPMPADEHLFD